MGDLPGDLARLERYAAGLQELANEMQEAAPQRSEGTDRTGSVRVSYGPDGLPESIRVSPYWTSKLRPDSVAAAVTQACQAAITQRGTAWSQALAHSGWQQRMGRLRENPAGATADDGGPPIPPASRPEGSGTPPVQPHVLAEETLRLAETVTAAVAKGSPQPAGATAANRSRTLSITLSPAGEVTCRADPRWVAQHTGARLTEALGAVLTDARRALAAQSDDPAPDLATAQGEAARLAAESLAALRAATASGDTAGRPATPHNLRSSRCQRRPTSTSRR